MSDVIIYNVENMEDMNECLDLRLLVFCKEQGFSEEIEKDEYDKPFPRPDVVHCIAKKDGRILGTCRLIKGDGYCKLGRIVTSKDARGHGIGSKLCAYGENVAKSLWDVTKMKISSQHQVRGFYEKCGYKYDEKGYYDDEGWPHCMLEKYI
ncbi:hypothetical protein AKO1_001313 [Acrasis kona]|uniref:N-acetyltransferase domain-containing protein n=1 Tax=Acrasis kona TaxID=1008807 RepID=A0AAW2ZCB8_9EUKA